MPDSARDARRLALALVYLATPLFLLLDWLGDLNLRAAFLEERPQWRWPYYGLLLALGLFMTFLPHLARPLATVEAGMNALLTAMMVLIPYVEMNRAAAAGEDIRVPEFPLWALLTSAGVILMAQIPLSFGHRRDSASR